MNRYFANDLDRLVTGRATSLLEADINERSNEIRERIAGARVLVVGGAGSIGASLIGSMLAYEPAALDVVDISENALAELVRDLHAREDGLRVRAFRCLPLDYGSALMERFLAEAVPFDLVLNFAALKHVRSEKDVYSLLQMLDVNLVRHLRFKRWLRGYGHAQRYFAVSTDKAANPTSMMGASKRLMEDVVFADGREAFATSSRFANVAFSNGSLLQSWIFRLAKGQPLAVPRDTRRYFVTLREAGEICLLAACCVPSQCVVFPTLEPQKHLIRLEHLAGALVENAGFEPAFVEDEETARRNVHSEMARGRYPVLLTSLDTSGEKPFEEFVADNEKVADLGFHVLRAIEYAPPPYDVSRIVQEIEKMIANPGMAASKADLVAQFRALLPAFNHIETGRDLDQRM